MNTSPSQHDLLTLSRFIYDLCGIVLDDTKGYLVESRLGPLVRQTGCKDYVELSRRATDGRDRTLRRRIVDAITTRETLFFRDNAPYAALSTTILPKLLAAKEKSRFGRRLRIWSAACSSGQEPCSIAITLRESIPNIEDWDVSILATDISETAILQAEQGIYSRHEVDRGLDLAQLDRYFRSTPNGWQVDESILNMIQFQRFNLHESFAVFGNFDIIFCRNVAIYFSPEGRRSLFQRLAEALHPGGTLFVGSSESLADMPEEFTSHQAGETVYYLPAGSA